MKTLHPDLFPETLLVTVRNGHSETDSLKVSTSFDKRHKNIIQNIETLVADVEKLGGDRLSFQLISYRDAMNREQKMYRMDRLAFSILVCRFTGTKALAWQLEYHRQFELMERQLQARETRFAHALDQVRPMLRPVVEATERGLSRSAIAEPLGKSPGSITYHRARPAASACSLTRELSSPAARGAHNGRSRRRKSKDPSRRTPSRQIRAL